jgi:hypothetical protein
MVLTEEELKTAEDSQKLIIRSTLEKRKLAKSLVAQCCIDRRIQVLLGKGGRSPVYNFNGFIIRNANWFVEIAAKQEPGWNCYGPSDPVLNRLIDFKFRPSKHSQEAVKEWSLMRAERKRILEDLNQNILQELRLGDFENLLDIN